MKIHIYSNILMSGQSISI
jgi:hypothetical protein